MQIESDEADLALPNFSCFYGRNLFAVCLPFVGHWPLNWWTRQYLVVKVIT